MILSSQSIQKNTKKRNGCKKKFHNLKVHQMQLVLSNLKNVFYVLIGMLKEVNSFLFLCRNVVER